MCLSTKYMNRRKFQISRNVNQFTRSLFSRAIPFFLNSFQELKKSKMSVLSCSKAIQRISVVCYSDLSSGLRTTKAMKFKEENLAKNNEIFGNCLSSLNFQNFRLNGVHFSKILQLLAPGTWPNEAEVLGTRMSSWLY